MLRCWGLNDSPHNLNRNINPKTAKTMTKKDKKQLAIILSQLEEIRETIDSIKGLEEEKFDNMSEGWQESERGYIMSENIDSLDTCYSGLDDAVEAINEILER